MKEEICIYLTKKIWRSWPIFSQKLFTYASRRRAGTGNTDNIVLNVTKEHLDMELPVKDLDNSHRIGKSNSKNIKLDPS